MIIRNTVWRKVVCVGAACAIASLGAAPGAQAAPSGGWSAPTEAASVADNVVTVGAHRSAVAMPELLGLNSTSVSTVLYNPETLAEACGNDYLGVFGSSANQQPNPYIANEFYNFYAAENGKTASGDVIAKGTDSSYEEYRANSTDEAAYGTPADLANRPDIVIGTAGAPGGDSNMTMDHDATTAINYASWGTGIKIPAQSYNKVLRIRTWTDDESLAGTINSDANPYVLSPHYKQGDQTYDPISVAYDDASGSYGFSYYIDNENNMARAAKLVMQQQPAKTTRYGDPLEIANTYEAYAKAAKWYLLSKFAEKPETKKSVAVVASVDAANNRFRLVKVGSGTETSGKGSFGTLGIAESLRYTINDLAADIAPSAQVGSLSVYATPEQLAGVDVVVALPPVASSFDSSASSIEALLAENGYSGSMPRIVDNTFPAGTFESINAFGSSVESVLSTGIVLGCVYPEYLNPIDMMTYWSSKLYHLTDSALEPFVKSELGALTLPDGMSLESASYGQTAIERVQAMLDSGVTYYYGNKASIDTSCPQLASTDALDDAMGHGVGNVRFAIPAGSSLNVYDEYGLLVKANPDGSYTLDNDASSTAVVSADGYFDYAVETTGKAGAVSVKMSDMTALKHVSIAVPEGATLVVKDASGHKVKAGADGGYDLDASASATAIVTMEGYVSTSFTIAPATKSMNITETMLTPTSTATTIVIPDGASLVVKDAKGKVVKPQAGGTYSLYDRRVYTLTVKLGGFNDYTRKITGGTKKKFSIYRANLTVKTFLAINVATVKASSINKDDAQVIKKLELGTKVKKISAKAFAKCPQLESLVIKSTKLKKAKVKNALKGSKIKTVIVPKAKYKAYKKLFKKAVCGKKVVLKKA